MCKTIRIILLSFILFSVTESHIHGLDKATDERVYRYYLQGFTRLEITRLLGLKSHIVATALIKHNSISERDSHRKGRLNIIALIVLYSGEKELDSILENNITQSISALMFDGELDFKILNDVVHTIIEKENIKTLIFLINQFKEGKSYNRVLQLNAETSPSLIMKAFTLYKRTHPEIYTQRQEKDYVDESIIKEIIALYSTGRKVKELSVLFALKENQIREILRDIMYKKNIECKVFR